jgi:hypothetical protein
VRWIVRQFRTRRRALLSFGTVFAIYLLLAYVLLPIAWTHHEHQPGLADRPMVTRTAQDIPGDPLNIGLIGDREDVIRAMHAAGWYPADPITLKTSVEIVGSVLLDRPYRTAPVSSLYYDGRREDLAFELPVGANAKQRHHVRFWKVIDSGAEGRPVWLGSATYDRSVGISSYTGQVTHDIAPDIDAERDFLSQALQAAGMVETIYQVSGVEPTLNGRNGEGSRYQTDGEIRMLVLVAAGKPQTTPPRVLDSPPLVEAKDAAWQAIKNAVSP